MARPAPLSIRVTDDQRAGLVAAAERRGISVNAFMVRVIDLALEGERIKEAERAAVAAGATKRKARTNA